MSDIDRELIARAQEGDVASFEALVQPLQPRLLRLILAVTANREDAEDCLQETLLRAYRALPSFRADASFTTWIHRVALNVTRNWLRAEARAASSRIAERVGQYAKDLAPGPYDQLAAAETARALKRALAALPDHYREPLLLRHYRDMSYEEIAEVLQIPIGTVRSRLAQGRVHLLRRLAALGYDRPAREEAIS